MERVHRPPHPLTPWSRNRRHLRPIQASIAAAFTWALTFWPGSFAWSGAARFPQTTAYVVVLAILALLSGVLGPFVRQRFEFLGRHVSISMFCGLSLLGYLAHATQEVPRDRLLAIATACSWAIFTMASREPVAAASTENTEPLDLPRRRITSHAPSLLLALVSMTTLSLWFMAFVSNEPPRSVLAQAIVTGFSVAAVLGVGMLAIPSSEFSLERSRGTLIARALFVFLLAGAVLAFLFRARA